MISECRLAAAAMQTSLLAATSSAVLLSASNSSERRLASRGPCSVAVGSGIARCATPFSSDSPPRKAYRAVSRLREDPPSCERLTQKIS